MNHTKSANIYSLSSSNQTSISKTCMSSMHDKQNAVRYTSPNCLVQENGTRSSNSNDQDFCKATKARRRLAYDSENSKINDCNKCRQQICHQKENNRRVHSNQMPELLNRSENSNQVTRKIKPSLVLEYILRSREVEKEKLTNTQHSDRCQSVPGEVYRQRKANEKIYHELRDILARRSASTVSAVNSKLQNPVREMKRLPACSEKCIDLSCSNSILNSRQNHFIHVPVDKKKSTSTDGNWILKPNRKLTPVKAKQTERKPKVGVGDEMENEPYRKKITDINHYESEANKLLQSGERNKNCEDDVNIPFDRNCKLRQPILKYPILRERNDLFWSRYFTNSSPRPRENWSFEEKQLVESNPCLGMFRVPNKANPVSCSKTQSRSFSDQKLSNGTSVFGYFNRHRCQCETHHYEELECKRVPRKCKSLLNRDTRRPRTSGGKNDRCTGQRCYHAPVT